MRVFSSSCCSKMTKFVTAWFSSPSSSCPLSSTMGATPSSSSSRASLPSSPSRLLLPGPVCSLLARRLDWSSRITAELSSYRSCPASAVQCRQLCGLPAGGSSRRRSPRSCPCTPWCCWCGQRRCCRHRSRSRLLAAFSAVERAWWQWRSGWAAWAGPVRAGRGAWSLLPRPLLWR